VTLVLRGPRRAIVQSIAPRGLASRNAAARTGQVAEKPIRVGPDAPPELPRLP
jgi:hypothetical protein